MPEQNRTLRLQPDDRFAFFRGFLKRPKQVGSIIPSSRFLERRVTRATRAHRAKLIVELGPGTGGTTRALLRAMQLAQPVTGRSLVGGTLIAVAVVLLQIRPAANGAGRTD